MNKFIKKLIDKSNLNFKKEFERQKKFFSKPDVLIALGVAAVLLLNKLAKEKKSRKETKEFLLKSKQAKSILAYTTGEINEDNLNDLVLACLNGEDVAIPDLPENLEATDFISMADRTNDIDKKINFNKLSRLNINFPTSAEALLTYGFLLYYVIDMAIDLFKTEHPSKYRTKHTQKLLRNVYGLLQIELKNAKQSGKKQLQTIANSLKQIDNVLIAITLATTIYIANRQILRKKSKQTLDEISVDAQCSSALEPFDVSVNKIPFQLNLNCPVSIDDVVVPHEPIELKLLNLSCEINQNQENVVDATQSQDLVTHTVIRNTRKSERLVATVTKDSFLTQELQIATIGNKVLYSPVNGYMEQTTTDDLVLRDIEEPDEDLLTSQINLLNQKYERLNYIKSFIKDYYVLSLYPALLAVSTIDDASTNSTRNQYVGISGVYAFARQEHAQVINIFERGVKRITGQDNVEKHAKNETLYKIKDELEEQEIFFYKREEAIGASAENAVLRTLAKPEEFILFDYYFLGLGEPLNALTEPSSIEIEFRNIINEIIRRRYVLEGYKKKNLEDKINAKIKEIEKGISVGNWFKKAMDVYNPSKKIDDLRKWLTGLADKNNKLNATEKTAAVNSVIFLFEFYLGADALIEKYTILKKETTPQKETVKEGTTILNFFKSLWKEFNALPTEIDKIQALIDSLSTFQTYSIIEWQGYQARLYTLCDEPTCESKETDPYLNPKSKYGYGDIRYWLKYCSFATLASVTNPATGWSTGWIFPTPIPFPVIYIPVKSIPTKYGFIVLGISICGIWIFPWALFGNLSSDYNTPIGNPTAAIKREIQALKKSISEQQKNLRKSFVKKSMDATKLKLDAVDVELKETKKSLEKNKALKPSKYPKSKTYYEDLLTWNQNILGLKEQITTLKTKKWTLEKTYKILDDAYKSGKSVKGADPGLEQSEKQINKQLDNLTSLVDKADKIIIPLPITMKPATANFGITLKNTKPIINIADELDDNINEGPLNKIFEKFKLKNDGMMATTYGSKLSGSIINYKAYKTVLSASMLAIVKKDPFPKYELLKVTNVPYLAFLYKDFVTTGAKSYGFPGQMPLPI